LIENSSIKIIPCWIDGIWGSNFSYYGGHLFASLIHFPRTKLTVRFGTPLNSQQALHPWKLQRTLEELGSECASESISKNDTLSLRFIRTARRNWSSPAISDTTGRDLTFGKVLTASILLSDYCRSQMKSEKMIGVMLPATAAGALVNAGITLSGKTPVNLNFTISPCFF
jgi:acyl-[acyl-carrier-protein]-phospholipid O-acyltransferase/long-chain-fatty-acid--[acyl-carrier-protein] ligase